MTPFSSDLWKIKWSYNNSPMVCLIPLALETKSNFLILALSSKQRYTYLLKQNYNHHEKDYSNSSKCKQVEVQVPALWELQCKVYNDSIIQGSNQGLQWPFKVFNMSTTHTITGY
jgi:hypothetical protein